jgi:hypothetical protein
MDLQMTWLAEIWHFIVSWAGIDIAVGIVATAIAILEPKFMDAITDLRKWAICTAVVAFTATGLIAHGYKNGLEEKQHEWAASLEREAHDGAEILSDAERDARSDTPDSVRNDRWNRDNWGKPGRH